ncbi:hypothetical protein ACFPL7_14840 [Dongia soli]|uniref:Uncharacterized protein n=1 Tax=Dongia soli TaxID=600628 RepID=A0ABU5EBR9_9PROT|nr:hypothetical protein [Dongia soli]MDY0883827.1 hypothetical protein [Dongia soli]
MLANFLLPNALVFISSAAADSPSGNLQRTATDSPQDLVVPGAKPITDPAAIKAKLDNITIYGRYNDTGEDWIEYHLSDGRSAYWEKGCTYPGKWWIDNGQVCYAYPNYRNNAPNCFIMFVRPDGGVQFVSIFDNGQAYLASSSVKMTTGNDAHLPVGGISPCVGV